MGLLEELAELIKKHEEADRDNTEESASEQPKTESASEQPKTEASSETTEDVTTTTEDKKQKEVEIDVETASNEFDYDKLAAAVADKIGSRVTTQKQPTPKTPETPSVQDKADALRAQWKKQKNTIDGAFEQQISY